MTSDMDGKPLGIGDKIMVEFVVVDVRPNDITAETSEFNSDGHKTVVTFNGKQVSIKVKPVGGEGG